jgi:hypothetical protein
MKVYIVFEGSCYPYSHGDIAGVFLNKRDAEDMEKSLKKEDSFIEEHEVIE